MTPLVFRRVHFDWSRTYTVGVVNVTPDSFSDGGAFASPHEAIAHGIALAEAGADVLDIGGESTRPGARPVPLEEELDRVLPVLEGLLRATALPIAVDTVKSAVAAAAVGAGADLINDISGGKFDPDMVATVDRLGVPYVLGHVGESTLAATHERIVDSGDPDRAATAVIDALGLAVDALPVALRRRTMVDPGLGFGKGVELNYALLGRCRELHERTGCPVYVGPSRKRFIAATVGASDLESRDRGTVGAALFAVQAGAHLVRVHDVGLLTPALVVYERARRYG